LLVLRRKVEEEIVIGTNIRVKILAIEGGARVRIGIVAPPDVPILREELLEKEPAAEKNAAP
jgi:carbon storage regulator